jgi:8-oxo-dGTP pyrophosphatase MutT (NUDIX family)
VSSARDRIVSALKTRSPRVIDVSGFPRAGVLLAVMERPDGPTVLFTRRTEKISHPGQVSFPGGHFESGEDAAAAALREAHEEVGLPPSSVEVLGRLDDRISVNRVIVSPVVGVVQQVPQTFQAEAREVVEIFEVSLERLLDPASYREEFRPAVELPPGWTPEMLARFPMGFRDLEPGDQTYRISFYDGGGGRVIWGLTARILRELLDLAFRPG